MANPYTASTLLSSAGVSPAINLDPLAKTTTAIVSITGASATDFVVQASVTVVGAQGAPTQTWASISSHYASSIGSFADGVVLSLLTPVAGLRLSSSTWAAGTATLQSLQSVIA